MLNENDDHTDTSVDRVREINEQSNEPPCGGCGGPHPFDTVVPSAVWNEVIRAQGLSEFLCLTCIVKEFAKMSRSFTVELWGDVFNGTPIEIRIDNQVSQDAATISDENTSLRARYRVLLEAIIEHHAQKADDRRQIADLKKENERLLGELNTIKNSYRRHEQHD